MGFVFGGCVIFFFGLALIIASIFIHKEYVNFDKNKRYGKAEVVGYTSEEQSDDYDLLVKLPDLNDGKLYSCQSGKIDFSKYPKGTIIDVVYSPQRIMGISVVKVHLLDSLPSDTRRLSTCFKYIAYLLFGLSVIFIVIGIMGIMF